MNYKSEYISKGCDPLSEEQLLEAYRILKTTSSQPERDCCLLLFWQTGLRISEILSIRKKQVQHYDGSIVIRLTVKHLKTFKNKKGKLKKQTACREIKLSDPLREHIAVLVKKNYSRGIKGRNRYIFTSNNRKAYKRYYSWNNQQHKMIKIKKSHQGKDQKKYGLSYYRANQILKGAFEKLNLDGRFATHTLRKSFSRIVYDESLKCGKDVWSECKRLLGHQSVSSTQKYLSFTNKNDDGFILEKLNKFGSKLQDMAILAKMGVNS